MFWRSCLWSRTWLMWQLSWLDVLDYLVFYLYLLRFRLTLWRGSTTLTRNLGLYLNLRNYLSLHLLRLSLILRYNSWLRLNCSNNLLIVKSNLRNTWTELRLRVTSELPTWSLGWVNGLWVTGTNNIVWPLYKLWRKLWITLNNCGLIKIFSLLSDFVGYCWALRFKKRWILILYYILAYWLLLT